MCKLNLMMGCCNARSSWILVTGPVSLAGSNLSAAAATWHLAASSQQAANKTTMGVTLSFNRSVRIVGIGAQHQFHFGGHASLGVMGVYEKGGNFQLSNLTLSGLPKGKMEPPYGQYPWWVVVCHQPQHISIALHAQHTSQRTHMELHWA